MYTFHILNFMVYKISWYVSDPQKFHKTILETHIDSTTKIIPTKFNNKPFCQTMKILLMKFNTRMVHYYFKFKMIFLWYYIG